MIFPTLRKVKALILNPIMKSHEDFSRIMCPRNQFHLAPM